MQYGITFLKRLEEESRLHLNYVRKWAALMSVAIGVCFSILVKILTGPFTLKSILLSFFCGLLSGVISFQASIGFSSFILFKRKEVAKALDEMNLLYRLGDTLGSFLFFVKSSNFEETLKWFNYDHSIDVKNIIAKVIFKQLNRSFEPKVIKLYINSYGEHSKIISEIMDDAKDICFTCIKAPNNWFKALDQDNIEHDTLPDGIRLANPFFNRNNLLTLGYQESRVDQFPTHYIKFLNNNNDGIRKRVFLLNKDEWKDLINPTYYDCYRKFMIPCQDKIDTLFVNVEELEEKAKSAEQRISQIVRDAIDSNITTEDYDIFEKDALMVYKNISDSVHLLEFRVGGRTKEYTNFIEFLFNTKSRKYGIDSVRSIL